MDSRVRSAFSVAAAIREFSKCNNPYVRTTAGGAFVDHVDGEWPRSHVELERLVWILRHPLSRAHNS